MLSTAKSANVGFSQVVRLCATPTNPANAPGVENSFYWATVCKTVRPMLSVCCLSVCPVLSVCDVRALWLGNATRVPGHPKTRVNPPIFKPVNPGLCAGKNPGFPGLTIPDNNENNKILDDSLL